MYTIESFPSMEAMKYYDKSDDSKLSPNLLKRKYDMINNLNNEFIASQKWDGNWMMFIKQADGSIFIRGRSRNVQGNYEDYSPKIPHLAAQFNGFAPNSSVILAEVCWPELGKVATDVGTILRCLPAKAVERQKSNPLVARIFDILMWKGRDLTGIGYAERVEQGKGGINLDDAPDFAWTEFYENDFADHADDIIRRGGEGVVIQRRDYIYEPGKRTAWKTLKLKQQLPEVELKVIGTLEPTRVYSGIEECIWGYWEGIYEDDNATTLLDHAPTAEDNDGKVKWVPVTKPYYYGWKMGVIVDYDGNPVKVASGTSDMEKEWLASEEAAELIKTGKLFAVVKGMQETSNADGTKSIRHPVLVRLRTDL